MAVVALAHRLCRILFAMRRDGTTFDLSKVGLEEGLFEHRVIHRYRFRTTASR
jgi:hypothetical protein